MLTKDQLIRIMTQHPGDYAKAAQVIAGILEEDSQILVSAAALENETTGTLMDMLAATILATLVNEEGGGRCNITFSPASMKQMSEEWDYTREIDGLVRTVRIQPKDRSLWENTEQSPAEAKLAGLMVRDEDGSGAKPQADPKPHDRPVWAVRFYSPLLGESTLQGCSDRKSAEDELRLMCDEDPNATIENRYCLHSDCPTTGCTHSEATSG